MSPIELAIALAYTGVYRMDEMLAGNGDFDHIATNGHFNHVRF